jgi:hypothetical protein
MIDVFVGGKMKLLYLSVGFLLLSVAFNNCGDFQGALSDQLTLDSNQPPGGLDESLQDVNNLKTSNYFTPFADNPSLGLLSILQENFVSVHEDMVFDKSYAGGKFYFVGRSSAGIHIYSYNETSEQLNQLPTKFREIRPEHEVQNGELLLVADDGQSGSQIWKINLASDQLTQVTDFQGPVRTLHKINQDILIAAASNNGFQLFELNPANGEIAQISNLNNFLSGSHPGFYPMNHNGLMYFYCEGLLRVYNPGNGSIEIVSSYMEDNTLTASNATLIGDVIYYFAAPTGTRNGNIHRYNITTGQSDLVLNFLSYGTQVTRLFDLVGYNSKLYFVAAGAGNLFQRGIEMQSFDPATNTFNLIEDFYPGQLDISNNHSRPTSLKVHNGDLYFSALTARGMKLYRMRTDEVGTELSHISSGRNSTEMAQIYIMGGKVYYAADSARNLKSYDLTTQEVAGVASSAAAPIQLGARQIATHQDYLYFVAHHPDLGEQLWSLHIPTESLSTIELGDDLLPQSIIGLDMVGEYLTFMAPDAEGLQQPHMYDLVNQQLITLPTFTEGRGVSFEGIFGNVVIFYERIGNTRSSKYYAYNLETQTLQQIHEDFWFRQRPVQIGNDLYMVGSDYQASSTANGLFRYNLTTMERATTVISPGDLSISSAQEVEVINGQIYIMGWNSDLRGNEIWRFNPADDSLARMTEFQEAGVDVPIVTAEFKDDLIRVVTRHDQGQTLWVHDPATNTTVPAGMGAQNYVELQVADMRGGFGDKLLFNASQSSQPGGSEPWIYSLTEGFSMVHDFSSGNVNTSFRSAIVGNQAFILFEGNIYRLQ